MFVGVIAASHERPGFAVIEPERQGEVTVARELVGVYPSIHRQMDRSRLQVLANGQDLDTSLSDLPECLPNLIRTLTEPNHDPCLQAP